MELLTQAAWAKKHGFSKQYAGQLVKNGIIKLVNGKVDPKQADTALLVQRNPVLDQRRTVLNSGSDNSELSTLLLKTRIKNEVEKGKLLEARAKAESGELVNADQIKEAAFNKARVVRDGMLNIPDRVASILASIDDEHQIHEILTREIRLVLEELSNG